MLMWHKARCLRCSSSLNLWLFAFVWIEISCFPFLLVFLCLKIIKSTSDSFDIYMPSMISSKMAKRQTETLGEEKLCGRSFIARNVRKIFWYEKFSPTFLIVCLSILWNLFVVLFYNFPRRFSYRITPPSHLSLPFKESGFIGFCSVCVGESLRF